jgi:hypothetical protein
MGNQAAQGGQEQDEDGKHSRLTFSFQSLEWSEKSASFACTEL